MQITEDNIKLGATLFNVYLDAPIGEDAEQWKAWSVWRNEHGVIANIVIFAACGTRDYLRGFRKMPWQA